MTVYYRDVSKYQGNYSPETGAVALVARCSYGTTKDTEFDSIRRNSAAKRVPFLPYHYLTTGSTAANQAKLVTGYVGKGTSIMLDVEKGSGSLGNVLAFMDDYRSLNGGAVTLVYLPKWYWSEIGGPSLSGVHSRNAGLVSSNYTHYSDTGPGWTPYGGVTPSCWQYTDSPVDTNAHKGTAESLVGLMQHGLTGTPPAPPKPVTHPYPGHELRATAHPKYDSVAHDWQQKMRATWKSQVTADGYFGSQSEAVAKSLQKLGHLTQDGVVGPATWAYTFSK